MIFKKTRFGRGLLTDWTDITDWTDAANKKL